MKKIKKKEFHRERIEAISAELARLEIKIVSAGEEIDILVDKWKSTSSTNAEELQRSADACRKKFAALGQLKVFLSKERITVDEYVGLYKNFLKACDGYDWERWEEFLRAAGNYYDVDFFTGDESETV